MNNKQDIAAQVNALNEMQNKIAQQLSTSHDQMRGLAKRVWRVQEQERKHIARELHDGIGQLLTALINQLEQLGQQQKILPLNDSLELARTALAETRELSRLMRPRILDDLGLVAALQWLVRIMAEKGKTQIYLQHDISQVLDEETQTLVFRVVQEAITNAVKHANANSIHVLITAKTQGLLLKVSDDGTGIREQASINHGFGLSAMRDRVNAFGGLLTIHSQPDQGCEVKMLLTQVIK
jgi:two-component system, NarL family, sensor kinase